MKRLNRLEKQHVATIVSAHVEAAVTNVKRWDRVKHSSFAAAYFERHSLNNAKEKLTTALCRYLNEERKLHEP